MAMKHFPNAPLFSTYKRRLPPHFNGTQESITRERARASPLHGLRP